MERFDDIPKYRKESHARPPKKSKHKHLSEPCIIESPADWWKKEHERSGAIKREFLLRASFRASMRCMGSREVR